MRLAALALILAAGPVAAEHCAPRDQVADSLAARFGEQPVARGLAGAHMVEVWTSAETGTFSIVVTRPDLISCLIYAGTDLDLLKVKDTPPGEPG